MNTPVRTMAVCLALLGLIVLAAILGPELSPYKSGTTSGRQFNPPSLAHWMGTDVHGRDVFSRSLEGARISLMVGLIGAVISLTVGVAYGLVSGYAGGWVDDLMMRFVELLYAVPRLLIVIILIALFDERAKVFMEAQGWSACVPHTRVILLFITLGLVEWLTMARIVRGQVLSLRERAFVQAARVMGQTHLRILLRHLLPNLLPIILVYLTLTIPNVILVEAFLSFIGLGVQAPSASWGTLLSDGAGMVNPLTINWWVLLGPAGLMAVTLLSLNFLGDALRDRSDPRLNRSR
ncbi:MAG: ABC transporter permease [Candidatus Methylacidiphilales bacterium]|nr:ABC transporter permease [Candidatus Methylacidiphilales bacterium]